MSLLTSFDAVDVVYQRLVAIKDTLQCGIYKISRPINSTTQDIVINSLGLPNNDIQQGIVNVNLHVPNLVLKDDGSQPDFKRMQVLTALVIEQVKELYSGEYWFLYQQQNMLQGDGTEHIVNIRIEFYSINL